MRSLTRTENAVETATIG
jgi:hypothetical protein